MTKLIKRIGHSLYSLIFRRKPSAIEIFEAVKFINSSTNYKVRMSYFNKNIWYITVAVPPTGQKRLILDHEEISVTVKELMNIAQKLGYRN